MKSMRQRVEKSSQDSKWLNTLPEVLSLLATIDVGHTKKSVATVWTNMKIIHITQNLFGCDIMSEVENQRSGDHKITTVSRTRIVSKQWSWRVPPDLLSPYHIHPSSHRTLSNRRKKRNDINYHLSIPTRKITSWFHAVMPAWLNTSLPWRLFASLSLLVIALEEFSSPYSGER